MILSLQPKDKDTPLKEGIQKGLQEGELIGKIQLIQQILKEPVTAKDELLTKTISKLQSMLDILEKKWLRVQN